MQKETEKSIYIDAFQLCVCQIPKCSSPHTVLVVPQKKVLCVPPEKRDFSNFLFSHTRYENFISTQEFSRLPTLSWARGRFSDIQIPTPPIHIYIPKAPDPLQVTRGFPGRRNHCENRTEPHSSFEEAGPSSGSASLWCVSEGYSRVTPGAPTVLRPDLLWPLPP